MIGPCIDRGDTTCLLHRLDRESLWAVSTIHKTIRKMSVLVEKAYPEERRADAYGSWREEAQAETPEAMFAAFCKKRDCLKQIAAGFGAVRHLRETSASRVVLETTREHTFEMAMYDGKWGLALFQKELLAAKLRFIDSLKQVEKNAEAFEEQRAATGTSQ
jgi:hypothetical protein